MEPEVKAWTGTVALVIEQGLSNGAGYSRRLILAEVLKMPTTASSFGKVISGWEKYAWNFTSEFLGGHILVVSQRECVCGGGIIEIMGPQYFVNLHTAVMRSHTSVCFIETGGANEALLLQAADSQHKFPFTPNVHEPAVKGALKEDFLQTIRRIEVSFICSQNEGIMW